jgi:hypothetical protein
MCGHVDADGVKDCNNEIEPHGCCPEHPDAVVDSVQVLR